MAGKQKAGQRVYAGSAAVGVLAGENLVALFSIVFLVSEL